MFWKRKKSTIHVEFVDAANGKQFSNTDIAPEQLPASFEADTTLNLGNQDWHVESASPMTGTEFRETGHLRLVLRRAEKVTVDPTSILFSLPTISDRLPAPDAANSKLGRRVLELHEDDWLQVEFFGAGRSGLVETHLAAVREVHQQHRKGPGFTKVHIRKGCEQLLDLPCSLAELRSACPPGAEWLEGIALADLAGVVAGSFAIRLGPSMVLYGLASGDAIEALGLAGADLAAFEAADIGRVRAFLRSRGLNLVDWCRCARTAVDTA